MSSQVTFAKMQETVAFAAGWDRTTGNWATDRDNFFVMVKKECLSQFENPPPIAGERTAHNWSFMHPWTTLELTPAYATGTVTIVAGVVTLAGGTFPAWAAQGDIWVTDDDESRRYSVNTRDSNTQVTLNDTSVAVSAGAEYSLKRHSYDLPADFGGTMENPFNFQRDNIYAGRTIKHVGAHELRQFDRDLDGVPCVYSLDSIAPTTTASSTWKVTFAPLPGSTMFLEYQYHAVPPDVTSGGTYAYGGAVHSETILASLVAATKKKLNHQDADQAYADFMRKLDASVRYDRQNFKRTDYGVRRWDADCHTPRHRYSSIDDATLFV
jgi:hypothetical protein